MIREKLLLIVQDVLIEMYENSEPKGNYMELKDLEYPFFYDFCIEQKVAEEILERHTRKLSKIDRGLVCNTVWLGQSPKFKTDEK